MIILTPLSNRPCLIVDLMADHKKFLFAVTRPIQKNCPNPKNIISLSKKDFFYFMFSDSVFPYLLNFPSKMLRYAVVNRGATERGMNWNKCYSLLFIFRISPIQFSL